MSWSALGAFLLRDWVEVTGFATTVVSIWLTAHRRMLCWPVTMLANGIYLWFFFQARLYSSGLLQLAFVAFTVYGWVSWWRDQQAEGEVRVARLTRRGLLMPLAAGAVGAVALGWAMSHTGAALAWQDAALASFSLVASWWQARRNVASWWLWIVVDVGYVGEYLTRGLVVTAVLYAALIGLCVVGLRDWRRAAAERVSEVAG